MEVSRKTLFTHSSLNSSRDHKASTVHLFIGFMYVYICMLLVEVVCL